MRRATPADAADLRRVCLRTGAAGRDATALHADPDVLGEVWAQPYLHGPGCLALVVEDDLGVAGYCVATADTAAFEDWLEDEWWPALRARHPHGSGATPADAAVVERIHAGPRTDPTLLTTHPAHLHVDLLPRLQGGGWGRRLVEAVADELAADGVAGLHLGVDPRNPGAIAFYRRLGLQPLGGDEGVTLLGTTLPRPTPATGSTGSTT